MMRRLPLVPTLVVAAAVALMIYLGVWQLFDRLPQKQAYLALLAANPSKPVIPFPREPDPTLLFRRTTGTCLAPVAVTLAGAGAHGYRAIAHCNAPGGAAAGSVGMLVQLGVTRDPLTKVHWKGGAVTGTIGQAPDARPLIELVFSRRPAGAMLVANPPLAGLGANEPPDPADVPNNHLSYAVQWFLFALTAIVIYALALRKRLSPPVGETVVATRIAR